MSKSKYSDWLNANYQTAADITAGTGIFPEILLSQAIIESAKNGTMPGTILAKKHNNYFGIKAGKKYTGRTVNMNTGEYTAGGDAYSIRDNFRAYNTPAESFADYVKLLQSKRYAKALTATSPDAQAAALKAAGYSTAPDYAEKIAAMANVIKKGAAASLQLISKNPGKSSTVFLLAAAAAAVIALKSKSNGR